MDEVEVGSSAAPEPAVGAGMNSASLATDAVDAAGWPPAGVLVALLVVLATILLVVLSRALRSGVGSGIGGRGRHVAIVGPCGAGKTVLFNALSGSGAKGGTVASMQENVGAARLDGGSGGGGIAIVDVPGHERLRHKLDAALRDARAVVFVVDSVDITPHRTTAAEDLCEVLAHPTVSGRRVPLLLACNKMDLDMEAHSVEFIERTLQKQLTAMRDTRDTLSAEAVAKSAALAGKDATKPLTLAGLRNPVTVAGISAATGDVAGVLDFMRSLR